MELILSLLKIIVLMLAWLLFQVFLTISIQKAILELDIMEVHNLQINWSYFAKKEHLKHLIYLIVIGELGVSMFRLFQDHLQIWQFLQDYYSHMIE